MSKGALRNTAKPDADVGAITEALQAYVEEEKAGLVFHFGAYARRLRTFAVDGVGLAALSKLLVPLLQCLPGAEVKSSQLREAVRQVLERRPELRQGCSGNADFARFCAGRIFVVLVHLRRIRDSEVRRRQALAPLPQDAKKKLQAYLRLMDVQPSRSSVDSGPSVELDEDGYPAMLASPTKCPRRGIELDAEGYPAILNSVVESMECKEKPTAMTPCRRAALEEAAASPPTIKASRGGLKSQAQEGKPQPQDALNKAMSPKLGLIRLGVYETRSYIVQIKPEGSTESVVNVTARQCDSHGDLARIIFETIVSDGLDKGQARALKAMLLEEG